jgi:hypothetical protein
MLRKEKKYQVNGQKVLLEHSKKLRHLEAAVY